MSFYHHNKVLAKKIIDNSLFPPPSEWKIKNPWALTTLSAFFHILFMVSFNMPRPTGNINLRRTTFQQEDQISMKVLVPQNEFSKGNENFSDCPIRSIFMMELTITVCAIITYAFCLTITCPT